MKAIFGLTLVMAVLFILPAVDLAFAAPGGDSPGEYMDRRAEIWNLFFRMMTIAMVVGSVVSGTLIWQIFRFRESNPKAKPTPWEEKGEW